jgi:hypothetical protein
MWGAAMHDRSTGVHRPLTATALHLSKRGGGNSGEHGRFLVALDHCLLRPAEMNELLDRVSSRANTPRDTILVFFSHTHGAGLMEHGRAKLPGGEQIAPYLESLADKVAELIQSARSVRQPACIVYGYGHCDLAANRDFLDPVQNEYVCGFNPDGIADDTLLVGRVTAEDGRPLAAIINYACHPTTLAWENTLISPDYVGAMRELVEHATDAPCLFIQGASGDMGPRNGFVADVAVADRNGRQLGHAALSALASLPAPGTNYNYAGQVISGATLGTWQYLCVSEQRQREIDVWQSRRLVVPLEYRDDLPNRAEVERDRRMWQKREADARAGGDDLRVRDARAMVERMTRSLTRIRHLPPGSEFPYTVKLWRVGDAVWLGLNGEHYNKLQREIRARFPETPVIVGTLANGSDVSYLLDADSYGKGLYQEKVSVLARGSLEKLVDAIAKEIKQVLP